MKIKDIRNKFAERNPLAEVNLKKDLGYQIGKRIELARGLKGMTQSNLAEKLNTKQSSISRIESGVTLPSMSFLMKIAEAFETYLTPPEFAFMTNFTRNDVNYRTGSSTINHKNSSSVLSPYANAFGFSGKSKDEVRHIQLF